MQRKSSLSLYFSLVAVANSTSLQSASLRGPYALHASFLSWFPRAMRCDEQL